MPDKVSTSFVAWFEKLGRDDVERAGGKGANLGEMTRAELPVPPGFVILADAYQQLLEANDLRARIDARVHALNVSETNDVRAASEEIQRWIREAPVPDKIISDIHDAYTELSRRGKANGEFVAVRSSATAEDTKAASFAGMNRSFTNVRGADAITSIT